MPGRNQNEKNNRYKLSKIRFFYTLRTISGLVSGGDGYFFYYRKIDDILTYSETETTEISQAIEKRVLGMTEGLAEIGRNIYEDLGEQYLIFVLTKSSKEEEKCAIQDVVIYLSDYFRLPTNGFGRWKWPACMK